MPNEVVVTGIGMVTPLGATAGETASAWRNGERARCRLLPELAASPLASAEVAALPDFDPAERLGSRRMLKYMSKAAVLGCVAAHEALADAAAKGRLAPDRIGLYAATGLAAASVDDIQGMIEASIDEQGYFSDRLLGRNGLAATNPLVSFKILANMPPCLTSIIEGIKGPNLIFTPWEGQAAAALTEAWQAVREGLVDGALAGAGDSAAHASTFVYLRQSGWLADGEIPASGAAYLFLESRASALAHCRPIHAVIEDMAMPARPAMPTRPADPLARRLGRLFAAAPPVLLALECLTGQVGTVLTGADGQPFSFRLGMLR